MTSNANKRLIIGDIELGEIDTSNGKEVRDALKHLPTYDPNDKILELE